jgi:hypothetical protein
VGWYNNADDKGSLLVKLVLTEIVAVGIGGGLIYSFASTQFWSLAVGSDANARCESPHLSGPFVVGALLMGVSALCSRVFSIILAKQWTDVMHGGSRSSAQLANANAWLTKIDVIFAIVSPVMVAFAIISGFGGYPAVMVLLMAFHFLGAVLIMRCSGSIFRVCPDIATSKTDNLYDDRRQFGELFAAGFEVFRGLQFRSQLVMVAYVLLFFTILTPGAMLTAWLKSGDVQADETTIAGFHAAIQASGAFATLIAPVLVHRAGPYLSAVFFQLVQTAAVVVTAAIFHQLLDVSSMLGVKTALAQSQTPFMYLCGFIAALAVSRVGLWAFELVERSVVQREVTLIDDQARLFSFERTLTRASSITMLACCVLFPEPGSFFVLVDMSTCAVCTACLLLLQLLIVSDPHASRQGASCCQRLCNMLEDCCSTDSAYKRARKRKTSGLGLHLGLHSLLSSPDSEPTSPTDPIAPIRSSGSRRKSSRDSRERGNLELQTIVIESSEQPEQKLQVATGIAARKNSGGRFTPISPMLPMPPGSPRLIQNQGLPPLSPRSAREPLSAKRKSSLSAGGGCAFQPPNQPHVQLVGRSSAGVTLGGVPTLAKAPSPNMNTAAGRFRAALEANEAVAAAAGGTGMTGEVIGDRREVKRPSLDRGGEFSMLSIGTSVALGVLPGLPQQNTNSPITGGSTPGSSSGRRQRQRRRGGTADLPTPTPKTTRCASLTPRTPSTPGSALTPHTAPVMGANAGRHPRRGHYNTGQHGRREPQSPYSGRMQPQSPMVPQPYSARLLSNIGFVGASTFNNISSFGMDMSPHVFGQRPPDDSPQMSQMSDGSYMDGMTSGESSPCTPYSPATFGERDPSLGGMPMYSAPPGKHGFGGIPGSPRLPPHPRQPLTPSYLSQADGFHELAGVPINSAARNFHRNSHGEAPGHGNRSESESSGSEDDETPLTAGKSSPLMKKDK